MSIQSDWQPASRKKPAEFDLDYVNIKVQICADDVTGEMKVRLATAFNTDWMEYRFEEWVAGVEADSDVEEAAKLAYPALKEWRDCLIASGKGKGPLGELIDLLRAIEHDNPGVIRG